jgi:chorismate dehydratase
MKEVAMRPRVGHIQFLNCLPLYYALVSNGSILDMNLVKGTPTEINRLLIDGKLDIGPISSIEYARNCDKFLLLPELTVSSENDVKSILLISKVSPEKLNGKKVALTNTSATSAALVQIILKEVYGVNPIYFSCPSNLPTMLREADAALLIGDDALRALYNPQGLLVLDLGMEWQRLTGKKMVYAVWAVRREFAQEKPHLVKEVYESLQRSKSFSLENVDAIAKKASRWEMFSSEFLRDYFLSLRFCFNQEYQEGLLCFCRKAKEYGFLEKIPSFKFVEV